MQSADAANVCDRWSLLLAGGATGPINSGHVDLALIVELIHLATLVHDDVMDEAERRRAQLTVNARWGNSLSVLLGDCLFAHALNLSTAFENSEISRAIARTASEICSGEMIQTQRRFDLKLGVEDYLRIVKMKTGSLFAAAAELGAAISEAEPKVIAVLKDLRHARRHRLSDLRRLSRHRGERKRDWQDARDRFAQRQIHAAGVDFLELSL